MLQQAIINALETNEKNNLSANKLKASASKEIF